MPRTRDATFDNSETAQVQGHLDVLSSNSQGSLRMIVERIENLNEEKAALTADVKEVFAEAKGQGFDVKILRKVIAIRKQDTAKRQEEEALTDLYLATLGDDL